MGKVNVDIPDSMYKKIQKIVEENYKFESIAEYIIHALENTLSEEESKVYDPDEEEKIKKRLRDIGYS